MEYWEGGYGDVGELVLDVFATTRVWQGFERLSQLMDEMAGEVLYSPADSRTWGKFKPLILNNKKIMMEEA